MNVFLLFLARSNSWNASDHGWTWDSATASERSGFRGNSHAYIYSWSCLLFSLHNYEGKILIPFLNVKHKITFLAHYQITFKKQEDSEPWENQPNVADQHSTLAEKYFDNHGLDRLKTKAEFTESVAVEESKSSKPVDWNIRKIQEEVEQILDSIKLFEMNGRNPEDLVSGDGHEAEIIETDSLEKVEIDKNLVISNHFNSVCNIFLKITLQFQDLANKIKDNDSLKQEKGKNDLTNF